MTCISHKSTPSPARAHILPERIGAADVLKATRRKHLLIDPGECKSNVPLVRYVKITQRLQPVTQTRLIFVTLAETLEFSTEGGSDRHGL